MDIASLLFKKGTPHQTFFKQFRAAVMDNLRKEGDKLEYKGNEELSADEKMTPTLEATIVLWALERIDPRLPTKVQKVYGHQMEGNKCLVTLQPKIFQNIPSMLAELDESDTVQTANSMASEQQEHGSLNAMHGRGRGGRGGQFRGRSRGNFRGSQRGSGSSGGKNRSGSKFCRICYHAGSARAMYLAHSISECTLLTSADKDDL